MSFVFPFLLGGLAVVGVPILLHLIMRQKPKQLPFPAFRFLLQKHRTNLRKLRLRHLLLLALRVLLLALICLALARPKISGSGWNIGSDQAVAAVLVFDTRYSMGYTIEDGAGKKTLLDQAKRRAKEVLAELPDDSKIAVLDTARANKTWVSPANARKHIDDLKLRPDNFPITDRLVDAYDMLDKLARDKEEANRRLPRFLYVFSNRTQSCWDGKLVPKRQLDADRIPPPQETMQRLPEGIAPLLESLKQLQDRLKIPGGPALSDQLQQLREHALAADGPDYLDSAAVKLFPQSRRQVRALIRQVQDLGPSNPADDRDYRDNLLDLLQGFLGDYKGAYEVFVDVGIDNPLNLAVENLELPTQIDSETPRQVFAPGEKFILRATVRATGSAFNRQLDCLVDGKIVAQPEPELKLKAGTSEPRDLNIDCGKLKLGKGLHQIEVRVKAQDALGFDDRRFATIEIREGIPILVIADDAGQAKMWTTGVNVFPQFQCEVKSVAEVVKAGKEGLSRFKAVYLIGLDRSQPDLWRLLKNYVEKGGGLAVMPSDDWKNFDKIRDAYNEDAAQQLLPGQLKKVVEAKPGRQWDWKPAVYLTEMLAPFKKWNANPAVKHLKFPRRAHRFWEVEPKEKVGEALVSYQGKPSHPAILETHFAEKKGQGKVLLFTSPFDGGQGWNNYMQLDSDFCVLIPLLTSTYLAGRIESATWNFTSGQPVQVPLPLGKREPPYSVEGPVLEDDAHSVLEPPRAENALRVRGAVRPGNYPVRDKKEALIAAFSVNVPPAECDLSRVPMDQITSLFGPKAGARDQWSQPVELLPLFLVLLLLALVVESFFANKFYRREAEAPQEPPRSQGGPS